MSIERKADFRDQAAARAYFENMDPFEAFMSRMTTRTVVKIETHCRPEHIGTVIAINKEFADAMTPEQRDKLENAISYVTDAIGEIVDTNEDVVKFLYTPNNKEDK